MQLNVDENQPVKRRYRKRHERKVRVYELSEDYIQKLVEVKRLYDKYGTLQKVAKKLNLTRERVRQILLKGQKYKLYKYQLTSERIFKELLDKISKEQLIDILKEKTNKFDISSELNISISDLLKLTKYYQIDRGDYALSARQSAYLRRYSLIVDFLGHHPSTTEMQKRSSWRATWAAIDRLWGSMELFRREFGIEKPPFNLHPNTIRAWRIGIEKRSKIKREKVMRIFNIIKENDPISLVQINSTISGKRPTTHTHIRILLKENLIKKINEGRFTLYSVNNK